MARLLLSVHDARPSMHGNIMHVFPFLNYLTVEPQAFLDTINHSELLPLPLADSTIIRVPFLFLYFFTNISELNPGGDELPLHVMAPRP